MALAALGFLQREHAPSARLHVPDGPPVHPVRSRQFAYLPQHLGERELTGGNGMVEMGTFVAILLGNVPGPAGAVRGPLLGSHVRGDTDAGAAVRTEPGSSPPTTSSTPCS